MILRVLFGSYHNMNKPKSFIYFVKLYCLTYNITNVCVALGIIIFTNVFPNKIFKIYLVLELFALLLFTLFIGESYFLNYCSRIQTINRLLSISQIPLEAQSLYLLYSLILLNIIYTAFQVWYSATILLSFSAFCFNNMILSACLNRVPSIVTFDLFRSTMERIRTSLEIQLNAADRTNDVKAKIITKHLLIYKHLLDNMRDNSKILKIFVSI